MTPITTTSAVTPTVIPPTAIQVLNDRSFPRLRDARNRPARNHAKRVRDVGVVRFLILPPEASERE